MDHVGVAGPRGSGGCRAQGADSICNGADDDGSGTVAVVELAEAFARLNPKPKRSLLFLNVSGEEKGLWGSEYFADHPTVALNNVVADLNIDMVGRNWRDTIVAIGKEHSDLGATLNRVASEHPELNMKPIDDNHGRRRTSISGRITTTSRGRACRSSSSLMGRTRTTIALAIHRTRSTPRKRRGSPS
jgi:acetylornithine deacetylase/succinyl-diaminopimelate desuccinylase-like protein